MAPAQERNVKPDPNSSQCRVFVIEPITRLDLSSTGEYGPIAYISEEPLAPFQTRMMQAMIRTRLEDMDFNPEYDLFCMVGPTLTLSVTTAVFTRLYGSFNVLMWDARDGKYAERRLNNPDDFR